jgi:hypothetical protein
MNIWERLKAKVKGFFNIVDIVAEAKEINQQLNDQITDAVTVAPKKKATRKKAK